ncbi:glycogen debranching protein GlgX [Terrarubrum flagellatum]|uniref:glycogen debranching protein GlgX n=1 Tax=Terrirubrum flagellatum TaxID=2895980 RepID=UPI0031451A01
MKPEIVASSLPSEMGLTPTADGAEIAVFSRNGDRVLMCLFDEAGDREIARLPLPCRTGDIHHGFIPGAKIGLRYGLRVEGPYKPGEGHRFDAGKLLVDPYARLIDRPYRWTPELAAPPSAEIDTAPFVPRGVLTDIIKEPFLHKENAPQFIYELPLKSFTRKLDVALKGEQDAFAALCDAQARNHLAKLGVSHIELLPIAAWMDERHLPALGLHNAWGYNPVTFMALDPRLSPLGSQAVAEAARRYREAGVGIILDIVFNHTAESDEHGATISLRGLDNAVYYRHAHDDPGQLVNDTGCGNTLALDRAPALRMAMDAVRHWRRCGVAGFRFDLATVMGRMEDGFSAEAPLLSAIRQDPELRDCILIAEPWDLGFGGYRLGDFPPPFREWNGRYRDDVRRFWRGDRDATGALATRLAGSADLFQRERRGPHASINYLAAHDGFTLADLVSHRDKHNEANGESNRDGSSENYSWNNGWEGTTDRTDIVIARKRDVRALLATLFVSRGVPMIQAGDEAGRSQNGNNNAYAQDNEAFWLDWAAMDQDLIAFVARLARFRREHPAITADEFFFGGADGTADVRWLRADGEAMRDADWSGANAFGMLIREEERRILITFNRGREPVDFRAPDDDRWREAWRSTGEIVSAKSNGSAVFTLPPRSVAAWRSGDDPA